MLYLCPADDFAVGFELRAVEDLDAGDRLHGLPIDGTDDAEKPNTGNHRAQVNSGFRSRTENIKQEIKVASC